MNYENYTTRHLIALIKIYQDKNTAARLATAPLSPCELRRIRLEIAKRNKLAWQNDIVNAQVTL